MGLRVSLRVGLTVGLKVSLRVNLTVGLRVNLTVSSKVNLRVGLKVSSKVGLRVSLIVSLLVNGHGGGDDIPLLAGGLPLVNLNKHYNTTNNYDYDYTSYKIDYKSLKRTFLRPWAALSPKKRCVVRSLAPGDTSFGFDSMCFTRP